MNEGQFQNKKIFVRNEMQRRTYLSELGQMHEQILCRAHQRWISNERLETATI